VTLVAALLTTAQAETDKPRIAIIIDDLGYQQAVGERVIALPGPVACAILPQTPRAAELAARARAAGKDVLLHLPLQPTEDLKRPDPGIIGLAANRREFGELFAANLSSVPHAVGINNHRGSLLTKHDGPMQWLMEEIQRHGSLFFVDSMTTHESVALQAAREAGVPATRRDVFLDPEPGPEAVSREFERLKDVARRTGFAVGIGHPRPATLRHLEQELPKLEEEGFELVRITSIVAEDTRDWLFARRGGAASAAAD
jgi:polysaccharide deacetylase 2 family uncharacterized protein YibQ